jgi:hypothetical protein
MMMMSADDDDDDDKVSYMPWAGGALDLVCIISELRCRSIAALFGPCGAYICRWSTAVWNLLQPCLHV